MPACFVQLMRTELHLTKHSKKIVHCKICGHFCKCTGRAIVSTGMALFCFMDVQQCVCMVIYVHQYARVYDKTIFFFISLSITDHNDTVWPPAHVHGLLEKEHYSSQKSNISVIYLKKLSMNKNP